MQGERIKPNNTADNKGFLKQNQITVMLPNKGENVKNHIYI